MNPYLRPPSPPQEVSFYDTSPLLLTLRRFADFALINRRAVRLSLGATNIATGDIWSSSTTTGRRSGQSMCWPAARCRRGSRPRWWTARCTWDGGCVSNSPLDAVVDEPGYRRMVVFLIDLWDAAGPPPETMNDVLWRAKQIQYASRTAHHVDAWRPR